MEGNFQVEAPGSLYSEGPFNEGFFALRVWVIIFERAYSCGAYFRNFMAFYHTLHESVME